MSGHNTIVQADVLQLDIPLTNPVRLGPVEVRKRVYVVLRFSTGDGTTGLAFGYDRGMPLFEIVRQAAAAYVGASCTASEALRHAAVGPTPAPRATMVRGVSLCDIALWDAQANAAGVPLHSLLGTRRDKVEVMPVIGYGMSPERAAREGALLADRGFRTIKLMIDGADIAFDRNVVTALATALPEGVRFGLDAHWSWRRVVDALPWCALAEDTGALFLEDPVAPTDWRVAAELGHKTSVPLCLGEDAIDLAALNDLAEAAQILRLDAAASGGIGFMRDGLALARAKGKAVIPHVFAPLHQHMALAHDSVSCIETILPELGADPIDDFLVHPLRIDAGHAIAPDTPGAGTSLDLDALAPFITRKESVSI